MAMCMGRKVITIKPFQAEYISLLKSPAVNSRAFLCLIKKIVQPCKHSATNQGVNSSI